MLPRWHIILGIVFCLIFKLISPNTSYSYLFLIFFSSVFVDFDHYLTAIFKHKKWNPLDAINHGYELREKKLTQKEEYGICEKADLNLFHTVESHVIIGLIAIFFTPFFFIFIGMVLHSLLDIIWMVRHDILDSREFFIINKLKLLVI